MSSPDPVCRPGGVDVRVVGDRMKQLNVFQVLIVVAPLGALLYVAVYQAFLAVGDFLRWVL